MMALVLSIPALGMAQQASYDGLDNHLGNLYRLSDAKTFSISPELEGKSRGCHRTGDDLYSGRNQRIGND